MPAAIRRRWTVRGITANAHALRWVTWGLALAVATIVLLAARERVDKAHVVLVFLLVVLGASANGGRALGLVLSIAAFLAFDVLFLLPYNTLVVRDPLDWLVLIAFFVTSLTAAQLLHVARAERAASERAEALRETGRLKDALLASVSHDLRTPLTTIKGLAYELSETGDERALMITEAADRLNRLVGDLLDAARLNEGTFPIDLQMNAVDDLLGAVIQQFAGRPDRHRLHAALDHPDDLLIGRFDLVQSIRIVTNLVENALKYAPVDTLVHLTAGRDGEMIVVRVADRGPGVDDAERARIFEPFYRPSSAVADAGSAGLGLSIARRLAEAQQGTLSYEPRDGGGAVFSLRLTQA